MACIPLLDSALLWNILDCGASRTALEFWNAAIHCRFSIFWIVVRLRTALIYFGLHHVLAPLSFHNTSRVASCTTRHSEQKMFTTHSLQYVHMHKNL